MCNTLRLFRGIRRTSRFAIRKFWAASTISTCLVILLATTAGLAQITPSADANTDTSRPNANFGASPTLLLLNNKNRSRTTYITFDLSSIPSSYTGSAVGKATLKLFVDSVTSAGTFNVDYANGAWAENTIDAGNAPPPGSTIAGNVQLPLTKSQDYLLIDVTSAVQAWLNGSEPDFGIALVANSGLTAAFDSKENTNESHPPELDIVFAAGIGTITGVTTSVGSGLQGGGTSGTLNLSLTTACAPNQVLQWSGTAWTCSNAGTGTITGVTAGTGLTGGGTGGNVKVSIDTQFVPLLNSPNAFAGNQSVNGNLTATGLVTGAAYQIGSNLFVFGQYSLQNAFLGFAGTSSSTGHGNTASGYNALEADTTGAGNTANGSLALQLNTEGFNNTADGYGALNINTKGGWNTAIGYGALPFTTTGNYNTGLGFAAVASAALTNATAIGAFAQVDQGNSLVLGSIAGVNGCVSDIGCDSTQVGIGTTRPQYALDVHGTGNFSNLLVNGQPVSGTGTITGVTAGPGLTGGGTSGNVTLAVDTTKVVGSILAGNGLSGGGVGGTQTLAIDAAKIPQLATQNTFTADQSIIGNLSAIGFVNGGSLSSSGSVNAANAYLLAGSLFASGSFSQGNAFLGFAGNPSITGQGNTGVGSSALLRNQGGSFNTAVGTGALNSNSGGASNSAFGYGALLSNDTGVANTAVGLQALSTNISGQANTAIGTEAMTSGTGSFNTMVGAGAGNLTTDPNQTTTGSNNTFLGSKSGPGTHTDLTNTTAIGANAVVDASNSLVLGSINGVNGATADTKVGIGTTTPQYAFDVHGTGNFSNLLVNGQPVGGTGTITGVTAGTDLTGGGTSGNVTLNVDTTKVLSSVLAGSGLTGGGTGGTQTLAIDTTKVPQLVAPNAFIGNQAVSGNLSATGLVTGSAFQIGSNLFAYGNYSNSNAFLGFAGNSTTTGTANTASGYQALLSNTMGYNNTGTGAGALFSNSVGMRNTGDGSAALYSNTSGYDNTANGGAALYSNTIGYGNTASGGVALYSNTTGNSNTASGYEALFFNTTGNSNTADGYQALTSNATGNYNTAIGPYALEFNTKGGNNTALGGGAGSAVDESVITGNSNTFIGFVTRISTGTLTNATAIGALAEVDESNALVLGSINGVNNATADTKVGIGTTAPQYALDVHGAGNFSSLLVNGQPVGGTGTITGVVAGTGLTGGGFSGNVTLNVDTTKVLSSVLAGSGLTGGGTGGTQTLAIDTTKVPQLAAANAFIGNQAVSGNLSATGLVTGSAFQIGSNLFGFGSLTNQNAFVGFAGNPTMSGVENTATGSGALSANQSGSDNTAMGVDALLKSTSGGSNTAVGFNALGNNTTGFHNTGIGNAALASNTSGNYNIAEGSGALVFSTTGVENTASGYNALFNNATGNDNTAVGANSGSTLDGSFLTAGFNTFLGADSASSTSTLTNATAVGARAAVSESNALVLGSINGVNGASADTKVGIGTTTPQYALDVHGTGNFSNLLVNGQPIGGTGTITGVVAGPGLTGGGFSGNVTLSVDTTKVVSSVLAGNGLAGGGTGGAQTLTIDTAKIPQLAAPNVFTANQAVGGNIAASGTVSGTVVDASTFDIGGQPFAFGTTMLGNSFLGFAGNLNVTNSGNTGVGSVALLNLTSGDSDTAVGASALNQVSEGFSNTGVGEASLFSVTDGNYNTGLGAQAGQNITVGEYNTAVGFGSGPDITTRDVTDTTAVGAWATVFQNESTAIGVNAVVNAANATAIGGYSQADVQNTLILGSIAGVNNCVVLNNGCDTTSVGIGTTTPDATLTVNGTADKPGGGSWDTYSDARLKNVNGQFNSGLAEIMKLHPIRYRYKDQNGMGIRDSREHVGFVAQDVQKVIPDAVTKDNKGFLLVNNDPIILAMLNAIKQQQKEIAALRKQAARLESTVTQLKRPRKEPRRLASARRLP